MAGRCRPPLRRSFSEHIKDSTNKAWDIIWKNAREKRLSEIEAKDACEWLRAAGFPQYPQLFEASQFPVDVEVVKNDHEFLDKDAIESLCRRLKTLNKCAMMKLEIGRDRKKSDESEDEEPCAISRKWTFQQDSRRWSRMESFQLFPLGGFSLPGSPCLRTVGSEEIMFAELVEVEEVLSIRSCSTSSTSSSGGDGGGDTIMVPKLSVHTPDLDTSRTSSGCSSAKLPSADSSFSGPPSPSDLSPFTHGRAPSKPKARGLLRKMERFRLRGRSQRKGVDPRLRPLISAPMLQGGFGEEKLTNLNCVGVAELEGHYPGQHLFCSSQTCSSASSQSENSSAVSTPSPVLRTRSRAHRQGGLYPASANPALPPCGQCQLGNGETKAPGEHRLFHVPQGHKPGTFPKALQHGVAAPADNSVNWRTGSFHYYRRSRSARLSGPKETGGGGPEHEGPLDNRTSIYDNVPGVHVHPGDGDGDGAGPGDGDGDGTGPGDDDDDDDVFAEMDEVVGHVNDFHRMVTKWTEKFFDEGESDSANDSTSPHPSSPKDIHLEIEKHLGSGHEETTPNQADRSAGELDSSDVHFERDSGVGSSLKLANRTVPKFIRKIKAPDFKDRVVFGVPLLLNAQRTGHALPRGILQAMCFLRSHCLDQVGLFRKSGVKSRIQALREMNESCPDGVSYEGQSAFDVADMVKQYFRDLPEPLFTTKLSESFLHIYQYLPTDQQLPAVQSAILLLPDENREALQCLLFFLCDVVAWVNENQMTPTNLAVCLAPSLFHLNTLRRESTSSRVGQRKYSLGKPDQRDLSENLAATQGLAHMIAECIHLFLVPEQWAGQHVTNYRHVHHGLHDSEWYCNAKATLHNSSLSLLREAKEKFRSWVSCCGLEHVEIACKKMDDNHPLRLWKVSIDVEKSPGEILNRLLREHQLWEKDLLHSKVVETLGHDTEIYRYTISSAFPHPHREYVVLRTWQTDSQTGLCVLAATSVGAKELPSQGVQANVITSQYHIEPVAASKSKLSHICRIDTRGRTPEWYNKVFGYRCAAELLKIRDSFSASDTELRETNI
ncbi:rho GTPase-activating protein 7 isoform X2 [Rhinoraja longicauda]